MFKIFPGSHHIDSYQAEKKAKHSETRWNTWGILKTVLAILLPLLVWIVPPTWLGLPDLTLVQQRVIAIFLFATLFWLFEVMPAWVTSVAIMVIMLFTVSDSAAWFFQADSAAQPIGELISYKAIMAAFADPTIMLFMGGFVLAIAATKVGLDVQLARLLLAPFGTRSSIVLLGFLLVTALFSMFISNTATAAMMLAFLTPVLKSMPADGKGRIGLAMAIPIAANVGGMGTPIGTPPNVIALGYLNQTLGMNIGFFEWMVFMCPYLIVIILIAWIVLLRLFPFTKKNIELKIEGGEHKDWKTYVVYATFIVTILLWLFDKKTGIQSYTTALLPFCVFTICGIFTKHDLEEVNWSVLWMVAGGFALGIGMNKTGLAEYLINSIPFNTWSALLVLLGSGIICWFLSNFISNTATAALLVPILGVIGKSMESLSAFGGCPTLLIGIAMSASLAMMLPISTPPNAIAYSTGMITKNQMLKAGAIVGVIGFIIGYGMLFFLGSIGFIG